jgi:hypothetical protein
MSTVVSGAESPKLHDDALKRVMTPCAAIAETEKVKGFHPKLW